MILLTIFIIVHSPNGDYATTYEQMDKASVQQLNSDLGRNIEIVDGPTYNAFISGHKTVTADDLKAMDTRVTSLEVNVAK